MFMAGALLLGVFASAAVARSISDVFVARDQVAAARALNADIRAELDASRAETSFAATPTYLRFAARGLGYGSGKERAFALRAGAPPAPSIVPLGGDLDRAPAEDVLGGIVGSLLEP